MITAGAIVTVNVRLQRRSMAELFDKESAPPMAPQLQVEEVRPDISDSDRELDAATDDKDEEHVSVTTNVAIVCRYSKFAASSSCVVGHHNMYVHVLQESPQLQRKPKVWEKSNKKKKGGKNAKKKKHSQFAIKTVVVKKTVPAITADSGDASPPNADSTASTPKVAIFCMTPTVLVNNCASELDLNTRSFYAQ